MRILLIVLFAFALDPLVLQGSALALAGAVAVPVTQAVKKAMGINQGAALLLAGLIAIALTIGAVFITGQFHGIKDLVASTAIVFGVAQLVFKMFLADTKG